MKIVENEWTEIHIPEDARAEAIRTGSLVKVHAFGLTVEVDPKAGRLRARLLPPVSPECAFSVQMEFDDGGWH